MKEFNQQLSEYTINLKYPDIAKEVIHEAKRKIIDALGCAIGAFKSEPVKIIREIAKEIKGNSTIIGTNLKTSAEMATFTNATMIRYLDFMDAYFYNGEYVHPEDNIASILAAAEVMNSSGKEILLSTVLAYEISCKLVDFANIRNKGWDHTIWISIASALATAKLMKLKKEEIEQATSIVISSNIPLRQIRVGGLSMWKGVAAPYSSKAGLLSTMLANKGMTGPTKIFEGKHGFFNRVSHKEGATTKTFCSKGNKFKIKEVQIKNFPAEINSLSAIESALNIRKIIGKNNIKNIKEIKISTFTPAYEIISDKNKWKPKNRETADHSMPYIVCAALLDGTISEKQFSIKRINSSDIKNLINKVTVKEDKSFNKEYSPGTPNKVEVKLKNNKIFSSKVIHPKGSYKNPMTDEEIEQKFRLNVKKYLSKNKADKILSLLWEIDKQKNIKGLFELLKI